VNAPLAILGARHAYDPAAVRPRGGALGAPAMHDTLTPPLMYAGVRG